ncbi:TetR family transcriptional regulator [Catellatospora methionotrophica]|uniref:TetR family transcriptional regulator n=1 Tax=Catellatospora methionotrophica TaxID=121620 RepID=A0A8J3LMJ9_9ACTN|nr:TetR family transcriptional regulator [Catellatospora methionotrophica]GIG17320.1 TetR family transcriptional regulator [Catellatospora methionotrophica]
MRRTSAETKSIILAAARERFAADGYERATIRSIAADAKIDPAMVMRYYGSKEKLFAAAAEFDLRFDALAGVAPEQLGAAFVRHFLRQWEAGESLQVLLRTGITNDGAAERMREIFAGQLAPRIAALTGDPASAPVRAAMVSAQMLGIGLARYILLFPPVVAMSEDDLVSWLGPTIQRYLTADRP